MLFVVDKNKVRYYSSENDYEIPTDSVNAIMFGFILSEEWEGYTNTAQITKDDKTVNVPLDENNVGIIPSELDEGKWYVSLFGVKDGDKRNTTIPAVLKLKKSGYNSQGEPPIEPSEDLYAKLIEQIKQANEIAQSVRDDADSGKFNGKDGKDGKDGEDGKDGKSAYELAVEDGFEGTKEEWLESLRYDHSEEFESLANQVRQDSENSNKYAQLAVNSATNAAASEKNAKLSEIAAKQSETNAKQSETNASESAKESKLSEENAKASETEAKKSEEEAKASANEAANSVSEIVDKLAIKLESQGKMNIIQDSIDYDFQGLNLYGWSKQDTTTGAQLFDASKFPSHTQGGATVTNNGDGSFTISGEGELTEYYINSVYISGEGAQGFLRAGMLYSNGARKIPQFYVYGQDVDNNVLFSTADTGRANLTDENISNLNRLHFVFYSFSGAITPGTIWPMVWQDGDGTWEPYTGGKPSPSPEYPQEIVSAGDEGEINVTISDGGTQSQTLTLSTPGGLPGIPVTSGGNYTDENGQAWICDEVDLARGVYVRRVVKHILDGSDDETWKVYGTSGFYAEDALEQGVYIRKPGLSNQFLVLGNSDSNLPGLWIGVNNNILYSVYNDFNDPSLEDSGLSNWKAHLAAHPLEVMTYLTTATEELLSPEELAQYAALHTYSPTTTVSNDAEAWMKVGYVADTKKYIDSKFVELAKQII